MTKGRSRPRAADSSVRPTLAAFSRRFISALEAVFHPELDRPGIAFGGLEVLEHSGVQNVTDTSQVIRTKICMVEGIEKISTEFDLTLVERHLEPFDEAQIPKLLAREVNAVAADISVFA